MPTGYAPSRTNGWRTPCLYKGMIDNFRLRIFSAVASLGSFTAAAKALGISQPAVSQNIAELEKFAGARLLRRSRGGVELTATGKRLLREIYRG